MFNTKLFEKAVKSNGILWFVIMHILGILIDLLVILLALSGVADVSNLLDKIIFVNMGFQIPLLFVVIACVRTVASEVQSGAITYVVASSVSRKEVIQTKMFFIMISIFAGFIFNLAMTLPVIGVFQNKIDITMIIYTLKLFGLFLLTFTVSGIAFIASTIFNKSSIAYVVAAGVPIFFFIMSMLGTMGIDAIEPMKYLSLNSLFTEAKMAVATTNVIKDHGIDGLPVYKLAFNTNVVQWLPQLIGLAIIGTGLYIGSRYIFCKKDLPL